MPEFNRHSPMQADLRGVCELIDEFLIAQTTAACPFRDLSPQDPQYMFQ
jgi:hypothetical protein